MNELEVAVDPGFKESLGRCFGNSFREAVPLRNGVVVGLLPILAG